MQQVAAALDVRRALLLLEPAADLLAGVAGHDVAEVGVEPVAGRAARRLAGQDLDHVAVLELIVQRHEAAVDPRADAAVADVGVDAVGEVDGRRVDGQVFHFALRRVDEDLVLEEIGLDELDEVVGGGHVALPFEELSQPGHALLEAIVALAAFLVAPVRGDAVLGEAVHLVGADLHFQRPGRRGRARSCAASGRRLRLGLAM